MDIKVTIIIPVYNTEEDIEIIAVDDGSRVS